MTKKESGNQRCPTGNPLAGVSTASLAFTLPPVLKAQVETLGWALSGDLDVDKGSTWHRDYLESWFLMPSISEPPADLTSEE